MPRQRYIQDPETLKLIPAEEYYDRREVNAPMVMPDIQPYQSMQTGEMITSRSQHKAHLKQHKLVEIGNEVDYAMKVARPQPKDERETRRRMIADILSSKGY